MEEEEYYKTVGGRIRKSRIVQGLTQNDLSQRLNISRSSLANIEAGRQRIQLYLLKLIATELEISINELILLKTYE